ncbi:ataxin-7-like protein 2a isoform X2 [Notolabrus celidotus]|uniref:ataxin-7-like protein 2a isoform X2 n=1 Tax=Notolabrus celidotus TaxID=1203425 RepID=UPI0014907840|nr:ataxin-7-like protein 2a isoform X2 [Notolabrus celidotus]
MMAERERAVKVMAALDRRVPSLDDFVGQSWTAWAEWAGVAAADGPDGDDCSKNGKKVAEAMSLSKEDMSIFGLYPGHDDFYLVVCSHCGQVVKPQAFEKHCERRHGPLAKLYARLRSPTPAPQPQPRPHHSHSPSHGTNAASASSSWEGRGQGAGQLRAAPPSPSTPPQYRHSKNSKDGVRHSPLEKSSHSSHTESSVFKQPPPLEPPMSSPPPSLRDPPWPHGGTPPGRPSPSDRSPSQSSQRKDSSQVSAVAGHRTPRAYNKVASTSPYIPGSQFQLRVRLTSAARPERECDLDKHCGVLDPDRKKVCTRLLTCNIHSIHQRRKVLGRSKNFDQLVAELKTKVREKGAQSLDGSSSTGRSPSPEAPREQAGAPHCRRPLASLPAFSRSTTASESTPEEEKPRQDEGSLQAPSPLVHGRISSDESDAEGAEEHVEFSSSATHPRPLAVCSFGSHALGHGIYTFDRRLHHLRSALSSMLEQHISAHLWKKIPQATDLQSPPPSARTITSSSPSSSLHSKIRTGSHISSSLKTASSSISSSPSTSSTSSSSSRAQGRPSTAIPSENSGGGGCSITGGHMVSPNKPVSGRQGGSGRLKNPVGRPSKQMLKLREEAATAAALRKRKAPSQEGEHSGPERNCILLQDRGRPPSAASSSSSSSSSSSKPPISAPLSHGQTNGTLSPSSKPRPQPSPSESHSPAAKAVWTYKRTHTPLGHSSPQDSSSATNNSHSRGGVGDSGLHGQSSGRSFEQGLGKKRKGGSIEEHSPSSKPSAHRLPSSSSSSSSATSSTPRSNFYTWKESKGGGLAGGVEKKLGTQKPKLHH